METADKKRFIAFLTESHGCWLWMGGVNSNESGCGLGYGYFWLDGHMVRAHRAAWEDFYELSPAGMCVCHKCDVTICVNPSHLFLGTRLDNMRDMVRKGRAAKHEKNGGAKLNEAGVASIRSRAAAGESQRSIARTVGVSEGQVGRVIRREQWQ